MRSLADGIRAMAATLAMMNVEADLLSNIKSTWDAIKEIDPRKKIEVFVERAGDALRRWLDSRVPGVAQAVSQGTGGTLILTPSGEIMSRDRRVRIRLSTTHD